jgi:5-methylcytosine-specific restriction enzyme subunit McrC
VTIPIRNLYYLFLYAWAYFPPGAMAETGIDDSPDLPNLFAKLLSVGTRRLLRRGLDRGYEAITEELVGPRGRLRLDRIVKETTQLRGTAVCDFDELTHDVLHNQILKATLSSLTCSADVADETKHELRTLARRFNDVSDIRLSAGCFRRIAISRNSRDYALLMRLCEFVFRALMPAEGGAGARFQKVLEDEVRMSEVFEEFLRNFFQLHRPEYQVRIERPAWHVRDATEDDLRLLPRMETDITLRHPNHTIIIDAKFYKKTLAQSLHGERVRSGHLYQLISYLQNERMLHGASNLSGMLIYPEVGRSLRLRYRLLEIPVLIATIDLAQKWRDIEIELQNLLDEGAQLARSPIASSHADHMTSTIPIA